MFKWLNFPFPMRISVKTCLDHWKLCLRTILLLILKINIPLIWDTCG